MGSKFEQLMRNYGKVQQFPMDAPLMPLAENPSSDLAALSSQSSVIPAQEPILTDPDPMSFPLKSPK